MEFPIKLRKKQVDEMAPDTAEPAAQIKIINNHVHELVKELEWRKQEVQRLEEEIKATKERNKRHMLEEKPKPTKMQTRAGNPEDLCKPVFNGDGGEKASPWWKHARERGGLGEPVSSKKPGLCYLCGFQTTTRGVQTLVSPCCKCERQACRKHVAECGICRRVACNECNVVHKLVLRLFGSQWRCIGCETAGRNGGAGLSRWHTQTSRPGAPGPSVQV